MASPIQAVECEVADDGMPCDGGVLVDSGPDGAESGGPDAPFDGAQDATGWHDDAGGGLDAGDHRDAGDAPDAGAPDAGVDAGDGPDAGDAGAPDAADGGSPDASPDASWPDAPTDGGTCAPPDEEAFAAAPAPLAPGPLFKGPVSLARKVGAIYESPVYAIANNADWLEQALAIITNVPPGTSSAGTKAPNFVDVTSLGCFSADNAPLFAQAIAQRIVDSLVFDKDRSVSPKGNRVRIRMAFAQQASASGALANNSYLKPCLTDSRKFIDQLGGEIFSRLARHPLFNTLTHDQLEAWLVENRANLFNGPAAQASVDIAWVAWGSDTITDDNWSHSKIVTNGVAALVGGSNLYDEYRAFAGNPVNDTDLLVWGRAASTALAWSNTTWRDYAGRTPAVYYHLQVASRRGVPLLQLATKTTSRTSKTNPNSGYPFVIEAPQVDLVKPHPVGKGVATTMTTYAGGVKGVSFTHDPDSASVVNEYDYAIGKMLEASYRNDRVEVRIAQQDFANSALLANSPEKLTSHIATGTLGDCLLKNLTWPVSSPCATIHRAQLVELLGKSVTSSSTPLTVKLLKSEGDGYKWKATTTEQVEGLKDAAIDYSMVHFGSKEFSSPQNTARKALRAAKFSSMVTAKGTGAQRLHSKYVAVDFIDDNASAASVGSLNMYNARFMHDYGNIIVGTPNDVPVASLRAKFDREFAASTNTTVVANARLPKTCDPNTVPMYVTAVPGHPSTPFGMQVDLEQPLTWAFNVDASRYPALEIEQYGREAIAEVAVSTDCTGTNLLLSTDEGADAWNYDRTAMTAATASMPMPPPGTTCSLAIQRTGSMAMATLTCGTQTRTLGLYALAPARAYHVTHESPAGVMGYVSGTCSAL